LVVNNELVNVSENMCTMYKELTSYKKRNDELYTENVNLNSISLNLRESRHATEAVLDQKRKEIEELKQIEEKLLNELNNKNLDIQNQISKIKNME